MKPEIKYGLIAGILCSIWLYLEYFLGWHNMAWGAYSGFVIWIFFIAVLIYAIHEKKKLQAGYLELSDGMKTGLGVSAICGIIFSIAVFIYFNWVNPEWAVEYAEKARTSLEKAGKSAEEINKTIENFTQEYSPYRQAVKTLSGMIVIGGIITLIISLVLKKRPNS